MEKLTIINEPKLLAEYGKAFYWINRAETLLRVSIEQSGGLWKVKRSLVKEILEGKTLGVKIELAKHIYDSDFIKELRELNENRKILAHGFIMDISNPEARRSIYKIYHRSKNKHTTKKFNVKELQRISTQARKVSETLLKDIENWMKE